MVIDTGDIANGWRRVRASLRRRRGRLRASRASITGCRSSIIAGIAILVLSIVASGLLMLLKIDTPFWRRNPYWFDADYAWGVIYAVHGFAAMALLTHGDDPHLLRAPSGRMVADALDVSRLDHPPGIRRSPRQRRWQADDA